MAEPADDWEAPWPPPALGDAEVQVWRVALDLVPGLLPPLEALLDPDETARARRFRRAEHGNRFTAARAALRLLLAGHLRIPPERVRFTYTAHGKPELSAEHRSDIRFNLAHSHDLALIAVARGRALGIDVERIRSDLAAGQIAERYFSPGERELLRHLPTADLPAAFFACWARKEAAIKAWGVGLSQPLDSFDVLPADIDLLYRPGPGSAHEPWSIASLAPGGGFAAALVVERRGFSLRCLDASLPAWLQGRPAAAPIA
jgi:4'-phosphopantetheinyl transferase